MHKQAHRLCPTSIRQLKLIVDASSVGLCAIMSQRKSNGSLWPVYDVEKHYSQTEKEGLAMVWAWEKFHVFLHGKEFIVDTDHKLLETVYSPKVKPQPRIERWALRMQPYKFKVINKLGPKNAADSVSQLVFHHLCYLARNISILLPSKQYHERMRHES